MKNGQLGFERLTSLEVFKCYQIKGLIQSSLAASLSHLQNLYVRECKAMVEAVMLTEESVGEAKMSRSNSIFPKLEILQPRDLPNLEKFCAVDCV